MGELGGLFGYFINGFESKLTSKPQPRLGKNQTGIGIEKQYQ